MSYHLTLGTSTWVSLKEDGFTLPIANLKCYWVTAIASKIWVSIFSASMSIISIFYRMHWSADSVQRAAMSAPTKPWVSFATASRSTSSASFIFLVWIRRISSLPISSGTPISIYLSNLPNLLNAGSREFGLLVAAMTMTWPLPFKPSMSVKSWETTLLSTYPWTFSLFGAIESISSIKMMAGLFFSAYSNAFLRFPSA